MESPSLAVDIIIRFGKGIVLIKRKNKPFGWAIPGGFVDYGETVENTARREAKEETNLDLLNLKQFHVYSDPQRDPRGHTISIIFTADGKGDLLAGDDAENAGIFTKETLPKLAFDHNKILIDYFQDEQ
ncbi:MAG: NUDIX hydrolase [Nanoarchaeota archaeon]